jgi:DNA-binding transcriptional ArsR family regulator
MKMSKLDSAVEISRALANPARLRIVAMLGDGELCVCQITEVLELAQSTVSGHLRELRRAGLVSERKDGRWVYFGLATDDEARRWLDAALASARSDRRLEEDAVKVEEIRRLPLEDLCRLGYEAAKAKVSAEVLTGG